MLSEFSGEEEHSPEHFGFVLGGSETFRTSDSMAESISVKDSGLLQHNLRDRVLGGV